MKYIFLCILTFLIILPTKLGYGQIRSQQQTQVCGFIRDRNGFPLSNRNIVFNYQINPRDRWQSANAEINSVGFYCINGVPKELFESRRGILRVLISGGILSPPFIREGSASAFYSGRVGNRVVIDIKVDSRIYYPSPSPTPNSTATPIGTPSPSPTIIPSPTPIRTVTLTPTPRRTPTPTKNVNTNTSVNITSTPTINPSPSPLLPPSKIDELLAKMNLGNIAFVAPDSMTLNKSETVYLKLGITQTIEELEKEIKDQGLKGQIDAVKGVKIDSQMQAVLTGGDDFKVTPITPDILPISHQTTTEWKWDVKPLRGGNLKLYLALNAIVEYEDGAGKRPVTIKTFDKYYTVAVPWSENAAFKFAGNNWQWLWTTLIVPVILWAWNRKRKKNKPIGFITPQAEKKENTRVGFVKTEDEKKNS